ncbi:MAG: hydroxymethylbilane synthase [Bdellovibrionales bacterium]
MRLKIAARRSDLARLQAHQVAQALNQIEPSLQMEFQFKASLGDLDQDSPLVTMGDKGVFTRDFHADLVNGITDLVVHSWKDLPVEPTPGTQVVATLPRADARDLLLLRRDSREARTIRVLSSSPRRAYNLSSFLPTVWPVPEAKFVFTNVRGNITTRLKKLLRGDGEALIVAKAALDRLLEADAAEFAEARRDVRAAVQACDWMVLPLSRNPCAPAQGALAIEIKQGRVDLMSLLQRLNHAPTFRAVHAERDILAHYGGGCHQKIGVSADVHDFGTVLSLQGRTDDGQVLHRFELSRSAHGHVKKVVSTSEYFPHDPKKTLWFERVPLPEDVWQKKISAAGALWVARANALPTNYHPAQNQLVWTAGVSSWQALAKRGIWVNGCADGLGEHIPTRVEALAGVPVKWLRLTHQLAAQGDVGALATYQLRPQKKAPEIYHCKTFFWMSGSSFKRAYELFPDVLQAGEHACGPGKTAQVIRQTLGREPALFLSWEEWRHAVLP